MISTRTSQDMWWVVTDLDGTLMDHNYDLSPGLQTIKLLQNNGIPVIPCTSKTAAEVRLLRNDIGLRDPFIVENGGAIYGNNKSSSTEWILPLGENYISLRAKLLSISLELGYELKAFNDLSNKEIEKLTGLRGGSICLSLKI